MDQTTTKKILIVEDDKDYLWLLRQGFEHIGAEVLYAENGKVGLEMAEKEKPDLMVIDILLPEIDGITMAKKIKETGSLTQMIFLTNLEDQEHITKAVTEVTGQADYIVKSDTHIDDVVSRVKARLGI